MSQAQLPKTAISSLWEGLASASLESYFQAGGYGSGLRAARHGGRQVIRVLRDAQMRTLDGAGEMVFAVWQACQTAPANHKYVVCVCEDPDPQAPIYANLIRKSPPSDHRGPDLRRLGGGFARRLYLPARRPA